ncbi:MAG TPA: hypothetical protein DFI01_03070 [Bacteroidales bacterium]|nr:hypothetical protein [Bacteroidales bacterium]
MKDSGVALMGMGSATGSERAIKAIENALSSPLLNSNDITGAKSILINIMTGCGEYELTMDELGEITDYLYEVASDDALIIRGLSRDPSIKEEISVTVIATGFEANSIFQPYRPPRPEILPLSSTRTEEQVKVITEESKNVFSVHNKSKKSVISSIEDDLQGEIDFGLQDSSSKQKTKQTGKDDKLKSELTLQKVKHMQDMLKKEGLSGQSIKDNIETFEEVPAYVRKNLTLGAPENKSSSKVSKFTLSTDENEGPILREDNAYLNDNVD